MDDKAKIFVGNIPFGITTDRLKEIFAPFGEIVECYKPLDKGFAFIKFTTEESAQKAIEGMNGKDVDGRAAIVNIAKPKEDRPRRPFSGNSRSGGFNRERRDY